MSDKDAPDEKPAKKKGKLGKIVVMAVGVLVLSQYVEPAYALQLFEGGSEGRAYLMKERVSEPEQLVAAIQEVVGGGSVVDPKVVESLVGATSRVSSSPLERLTPREREVRS